MSLTSEFLPDRRDLVAYNKARMSPDAFRRAFPTEAKPTESETLRSINAKLRRTVDRLERDNDLLRKAVEELKTKRTKPISSICPRMAEVMAFFFEELASRDYKINGKPYTQADLMSPRKAAIFVPPRHVLWWLLRNLCKDQSLPQIARFVGRGDHTSLMHGIARAPAWMEENKQLLGAAMAVMKRFEVAK